MSHIEPKMTWAKDMFAQGKETKLSVRTANKELNTADIGVKYLTRTSLDHLMNLMNVKLRGKEEVGADGST